MQEEARGGPASQVPVYATVKKDRDRTGRRIAGMAGPGRGAVAGAGAGTGPGRGAVADQDSPYQLRPRSLMLSYKH